jgi:hypothetical protein
MQSFQYVALQTLQSILPLLLTPLHQGESEERLHQKTNLHCLVREGGTLILCLTHLQDDEFQVQILLAVIVKQMLDC